MKSFRYCLAVVIAVLFAAQAQAQPGPPPPSVTFTNGPAAIENTRGVVFDVKWADCAGIARVEARVVDKKTGVQLMAPKFDTTDASASKINWQILLPDAAKDQVVQVTVLALTSAGAEIAKTNTVEVKLK